MPLTIEEYDSTNPILSLKIYLRLDMIKIDNNINKSF